MISELANENFYYTPISVIKLFITAVIWWIKIRIILYITNPQNQMFEGRSVIPIPWSLVVPFHQGVILNESRYANRL